MNTRKILKEKMAIFLTTMKNIANKSKLSLILPLGIFGLLIGSAGSSMVINPNESKYAVGDSEFQASVEFNGETTNYAKFTEAWTYAIGRTSTKGTRPTVKLLNDVKTTASTIITAGKYITLDLNGFSLDRGLTSSTSNGAVIINKGDFILDDTSPDGDGIVTGGFNSTQPNNLNPVGGGVQSEKNSVFVLKGGNITGNKAVYSAGVGIQNNATFIMEGGIVSYNEISGNLGSGGGVYVDGNSRFELHGGEILHNETASGGSGVMLIGSTALMTGGKISYNSSRDVLKSNGGGIYIHTSEFIMTGGEISYNSAWNGAGIYQERNDGGKPTPKPVALLGGVIENNNAINPDAGAGGGVYIGLKSGQTSNFFVGGDVSIKNNVSGGTITEDGLLEGGTTANLVLPQNVTMTIGFTNDDYNVNTFTGDVGITSKDSNRNDTFVTIAEGVDTTGGLFSNDLNPYLHGEPTSGGLEWEYEFENPVVTKKPTGEETGVVQRVAIGAPDVFEETVLNKLNLDDYDVEYDDLDAENPKIVYTLKDEDGGEIKIYYDLPPKDDESYNWTLNVAPTLESEGELTSTHPTYPGLVVSVPLPKLNDEDYTVSLDPVNSKIIYTLNETKYGTYSFSVDDELALAKADATKELEEYLAGITDPSDEVKAIIDTAKTDINNATVIKVIDSIVEQAMNDVLAQIAIEEEAKIQVAKDVAIAAINDKVNGLDSSDYSPENWQTILDEQAAAITNINAATTIELVDEAKVVGLEAIENIKTLAEEAAQALADAKADAIKELEDYLAGLTDPSDDVKDIIAQAKDDIANATSVGAIETLVDNAKNDVVEQIEKEAVEDLQKEKDAAIDAINAKVDSLDKDDYSDDDWQTILDEQTEAIANINAATTIELVDEAKVVGLEAIENIKTLAEEAAQALADAKADAIKELEDYLAGLTDPSDDVKDIIAQAKDDIANATSVGAIETLVDNAKNDVVEQIEKEAVEDLQKEKDAAIDAINAKVDSLDKDDYSDDDWQTILDEQTEAIANINAATSKSGVNSAKNSGIQKIENVKPLTPVVDPNARNLWPIIAAQIAVMSFLLIASLVLLFISRRNKKKDGTTKAQASVLPFVLLANFIPNGAIPMIVIFAIVIAVQSGLVLYQLTKVAPKLRDADEDDEDEEVEQQEPTKKVEVKAESKAPIIIPIVATAKKEMPIFYNHSFQARRHLMDEKTLDLYNMFKNHIMQYEDVSVNQTWDHEIFMTNGRAFARLRFHGKTFKLYLDVKTSDYPDPKFPLIDMSGRKIDETTPTLLNIKGPRMMKYGLDIIDEILAKREIKKLENYKEQNFEVEKIDRERLIEMGLIVIGSGKYTHQEVAPVVVAVESPTTIYNYSFQARRHLMDEKTLELYNMLKNHIMKHEGVNTNQTWDHEIFTSSGRAFVRLRFHGKTMKVYLDLDAKNYPDPKFPLIDESGRKSESTTNTLLNVKGPRMMKYALDLIDDIIKERGLVVNEAYVDENFKIKAISREKLVEMGLIKVKEVSI